MRDMLRSAYRRFRTWRRRRKLLALYAKEGRVRHGLGPGLSTTMYAYDRVLNEDLAVLVEREDGIELVWTWPADESTPTDTDDDLVADGGVDQQCPHCGRDAAVVVDVNSLGTVDPLARAGEVHTEIIWRGLGRAWRLYCHEEADFA